MRVFSVDDDDMLTPTGYPPPTQRPTRPIAHTAHSQPCGHTALPAGYKTTSCRYILYLFSYLSLYLSISIFLSIYLYVSISIVIYVHIHASGLCVLDCASFSGADIYICLSMCLFMYIYVHLAFVFWDAFFFMAPQRLAYARVVH